MLSGLVAGVKLGRSDGGDDTHWSSTFPAPPEADSENKMTFFSHWVNPEVKCDRLEEPFVLSKSETEAEPKIKEPETSQTPVRANTEKTTKDPKAKALSAKNI